MVYGLMPCISFPNIFGINSEFDAQGEWFVFVHYLSKFLLAFLKNIFESLVCWSMYFDPKAPNSKP